LGNAGVFRLSLPVVADTIEAGSILNVAFHLDIPESVANSLRLPESEVEPRLRSELAVALYSQGILPFGKACELAGASRYAFADLIGGRNIPRHFTEEDLDLDMVYARGQ
jgi:predicted HTH domain antitoxin